MKLKDFSNFSPICKMNGLSSSIKDDFYAPSSSASSNLANEEIVEHMLRAIQQIRIERQRPTLERIAAKLESQHRIRNDVIVQQLKLAVQSGQILRINHKGVFSYNDPASFKQAAFRRLQITPTADLSKVVTRSVKEMGETKGSTVGTIRTHIERSYAVRLAPNVDFNEVLQTALSKAVRKRFLRSTADEKNFFLGGRSISSKFVNSSTAPLDDQPANDKISTGRSTKKLSNLLSDLESEPESKAVAKSCLLCNGTAFNNPDGMSEELLTCQLCGNSGHPSCLNYTPELAARLLNADFWHCADCKRCDKCKDKRGDLSYRCDGCDKGFHRDCIADPPKKVSDLWLCNECKVLETARHNKKLVKHAAANVKRRYRRAQQERKRKNDRRKAKKLTPGMNNGFASALDATLKSQGLVDSLTLYFTPTNKRRSRVAQASLVHDGDFFDANATGVIGLGEGRSSLESSDDEDDDDVNSEHSALSTTLLPPTLNAEEAKNTKGTSNPSSRCRRRFNPGEALNDVNADDTVGSSGAYLSSASTSGGFKKRGRPFKNAACAMPPPPTLTIDVDMIDDEDFMASTSRNIFDKMAPRCRAMPSLTPNGDGRFVGADGESLLSPRRAASTTVLPSGRRCRRATLTLSGVEPETSTTTPKKSLKSQTTPFWSPLVSPEKRHKTAKFVDLTEEEPADITPEDKNLFQEVQQTVKKNVDMPVPDLSASCPSTIQFGRFEIKTWYSAPYPQEYARLTKLYICEFCLKYIKSADIMKRHFNKCTIRHPPGNEIYRKGDLSVFEVDGSVAKIYCQNLCLLAKLFLDHKTLFYDVEPFLFNVLTQNDDLGCHLVGYFSKEKYSPLKHNVSCIVTLPQYQKRGYGRFLIDFSYLLSRRENQPGAPEKPLSDLGRISYFSYWLSCILEHLHNCKSSRKITIKSISRTTGMTSRDIVDTLNRLNFLSVKDGRQSMHIDWSLVKNVHEKAKSNPQRIWLDEECLRWQPIVHSPQRNLASFGKSAETEEKASDDSLAMKAESPLIVRRKIFSPMRETNEFHDPKTDKVAKNILCSQSSSPLKSPKKVLNLAPKKKAAHLLVPRGSPSASSSPSRSRSPVGRQTSTNKSSKRASVNHRKYHKNLDHNLSDEEFETDEKLGDSSTCKGAMKRRKSYGSSSESSESDDGDTPNRRRKVARRRPTLPNGRRHSLRGRKRPAASGRGRGSAEKKATKLATGEFNLDSVKKIETNQKDVALSHDFHATLTTPGSPTKSVESSNAPDVALQPEDTDDDSCGADDHFHHAQADGSRGVGRLDGERRSHPSSTPSPISLNVGDVAAANLTLPLTTTPSAQPTSEAPVTSSLPARTATPAPSFDALQSALICSNEQPPTLLRVVNDESKPDTDDEIEQLTKGTDKPPALSPITADRGADPSSYFGEEDAQNTDDERLPPQLDLMGGVAENSAADDILPSTSNGELDSSVVVSSMLFDGHSDRRQNLPATLNMDAAMLATFGEESLTTIAEQSLASLGDKSSFAIFSEKLLSSAGEKLLNDKFLTRVVDKSLIGGKLSGGRLFGDDAPPTAKKSSGGRSTVEPKKSTSTARKKSSSTACRGDKTKKKPSTVVTQKLDKTSSAKKSSAVELTSNRACPIAPSAVLLPPATSKASHKGGTAPVYASTPTPLPLVYGMAASAAPPPTKSPVMPRSKTTAPLHPLATRDYAGLSSTVPLDTHHASYGGAQSQLLNRSYESVPSVGFQPPPSAPQPLPSCMESPRSSSQQHRRSADQQAHQMTLQPHQHPATYQPVPAAFLHNPSPYLGLHHQQHALAAQASHVYFNGQLPADFSPPSTISSCQQQRSSQQMALQAQQLQQQTSSRSSHSQQPQQANNRNSSSSSSASKLSHMSSSQHLPPPPQNLHPAAASALIDCYYNPPSTSASSSLSRSDKHRQQQAQALAQQQQQQQGYAASSRGGNLSAANMNAAFYGAAASPTSRHLSAMFQGSAYGFAPTPSVAHQYHHPSVAAQPPSQYYNAYKFNPANFSSAHQSMGATQTPSAMSVAAAQPPSMNGGNFYMNAYMPPSNYYHFAAAAAAPFFGGAPPPSAPAAAPSLGGHGGSSFVGPSSNMAAAHAQQMAPAAAVYHPAGYYGQYHFPSASMVQSMMRK